LGADYTQEFAGGYGKSVLEWQCEKYFLVLSNLLSASVIPDKDWRKITEIMLVSLPAYTPDL
jgi:hypothetical protein